MGQEVLTDSVLSLHLPLINVIPFHIEGKTIPFAPFCAVVKVQPSAFTITLVYSYYVLIV